MNWIEIDNILYKLYDEWDGVNESDYLKTVQKKFKWSASQAEAATRLIIKQKNRNKEV